MMYIRDAIAKAQRLAAESEHHADDYVRTVPTEVLSALVLAAECAEKLMNYTSNDGKEKVVVQRGFGRDYTKVMNRIRINMAPKGKEQVNGK